VKPEFIFQVENTGHKTFDFSFAWHSYFQVKQIQQTQIQGLQQAEFMDQLNHHQRDVEDQAVTFQQETDRIYPKALGHYQINKQMPDHQFAHLSVTVWWCGILGKQKPSVWGILLQATGSVLFV
jgi:glucose-6-phosphate 1-epimerase